MGSPFVVGIDYVVIQIFVKNIPQARIKHVAILDYIIANFFGFVVVFDMLI